MTKTEKANMEKLLALRRRLDAEIKTLTDRMAGVDMAIAMMRGDGDPLPPDSQTQPPLTRKRNVKKTVMEIASEASAGVTAAEVVDRARAMGRDLTRASVSSLLSKFKADGVLRFDGERYYPTSVPCPEPSQRSFKIVNGAGVEA
jgi:hypothetical protein